MEKLPAGKYTLTEVTAPDGYAIAERMEFEVLPNGEVQTFEMFDDTIKVKISKVDITTNEELPGAELVIKDKDGTEIDRWISTNGPHYVEKMPARTHRHLPPTTRRPRTILRSPRRTRPQRPLHPLQPPRRC